MGANWANCPGPTPGSDRTVNQHKAMAAGCEIPTTKRKVKVQLQGSQTGSTKAPGLSGMGKKR